MNDDAREPGRVPVQAEMGLPDFLTNPIALLRFFVPLALLLGVLDAIPHPDSSVSNALDQVVSRLFRISGVLSVLVLTLLLLNRPAAEQRGPAASLTDSVIKIIADMADNLGWIVGALGLTSAVLIIPITDPFDGFLDWTEDFLFELAATVAFTALVVALLGLVRAREGKHDDSNLLRPSTPAEASALLRDATVAIIGLVLAGIVVDLIDEIDNLFDGADGFADVFDSGLWFLLALASMEAVLLGLAWAIEQRSGKTDPASLTTLARNVPSTMKMFWDGPAFARTARQLFLGAAILYPIANFVASGGLDSGPGGRNWDLHVFVLSSDLLWIAMFGGVLWAVTAGITLLAGGTDGIPTVTSQAMYAIGALASLSAILSFIYFGGGYGFYDAFFGTLIYYWALGGGAIAGLVALRALYWDRTGSRA